MTLILQLDDGSRIECLVRAEEEPDLQMVNLRAGFRAVQRLYLRHVRGVANPQQR